MAIWRSSRAAGGLLLALAVLAGCKRAQPPYRLLPDDVAVLRTGQQVYVKHCAGCHGAQLEGAPDWRTRDAAGRLPAPPHDASGHTWHHPDEVLFRITKEGVAQAAGLKDYVSLMPPYQGVLSDAEIVAVLSFIKAHWPPDVRRKHDELNAGHEKKKE